MQIEIDFDVFKALTALRESEADSYNGVIRNLLNLPKHNTEQALTGLGMFGRSHARAPALRASVPALGSALMGALGGIWFGNIHFPEGTKFRATYKGRTYLAEIKEGQWIGSDGVARSSPSDAAGAISGTNVNGWRFWHALRPDDLEWRRLDEFKS